MDYIFILGTLAAALTTIAFVPQVVKAHQTRETKDLSLVMFVLFSIGLSLWTVYGIILNQLPIIAANTITLLMSLYLIYLKKKYG